jgi:hypothetical protein
MNSIKTIAVAGLLSMMAAAPVGGLAVSQLLTLYTTPVVYIYLDRLQTWLFSKQKPAIDGSASAAPAE